MIKWNLKFILLGMVWFISTASAAPLPMSGDPVQQFKPLENRIVRLMRKYDIPGASVAVMRNGKLLYARGIGWANVQDQTPVDPDSLFRIASISKAVTAAAVIKLVQSGKVHYDTPIFSVLDNLQPRPGMHKNPLIKRIKVIDTLRMLSGWDGDEYIGFDPVFGPWPSAYVHKLGAPVPPSCQLAAEFMMGMPLQNLPGTHFSYANINYCLLGLLVNRLSGLAGYSGYEQYVQENVLEPMGISDMQIGSTVNVASDEVHYYASESNVDFPYGAGDILHKAYASGGWLATATDLVKFEYGFMKLLDKDSLARLEENPPGLRYPMTDGYYPRHYAMGWFISRRLNGTLWVTHGSFTGTRSIIVKRPDGYVVAVIFNKRPWNHDAGLSDLTYNILNTKI